MKRKHRIYALNFNITRSSLRSERTQHHITVINPEITCDLRRKTVSSCGRKLSYWPDRENLSISVPNARPYDAIRPARPIIQKNAKYRQERIRRLAVFSPGLTTFVLFIASEQIISFFSLDHLATWYPASKFPGLSSCPLIRNPKRKIHMLK